MFYFKSAHSGNFTVSLQIERLDVLRTMQVPWQQCSNDAFPWFSLSLLLLNLKMGVRHKGFAGDSRTPWVFTMGSVFSQHVFAFIWWPWNRDYCLKRHWIFLILYLRDVQSEYFCVTLGPEATLWPSGVRGGQPSGFTDDLLSTAVSSAATPWCLTGLIRQKRAVEKRVFGLQCSPSPTFFCIAVFLYSVRVVLNHLSLDVTWHCGSSKTVDRPHLGIISAKVPSTLGCFHASVAHPELIDFDEILNSRIN